MNDDLRLKKCPVCHHYWCYVNDAMCPNCSKKQTKTDLKIMENPIGFTREETKKLTLPKVRKKQ